MITSLNEWKKYKASEQINEASDKVASEYKDILDGAGWATDNYIDNFSPLKKKEKYELMIKLAKAGLLFDEEKIEDSEDERKPKKGKMSVADVKKNWSKLID